MTRLLQISDTHFGTERLDVMEALVRLAQQQRPDVLVLSVDITQRARASEFRRARAFCDRLQVPHMLSLPGNHDIPLLNLYGRLTHPYAAYQRSFGAELEPLLQTPALLVIGVKTTRRWRHKNGEVSAAQIERVRWQLEHSRPQQLRVVVVHQPVHVLRQEDEHDRLRGWEAAVRSWSRAGADIVMGGHIHLPYVCELSATMKDLARPMWCVQAGTAVSSRVRAEAPNSVNVVHYESSGASPRCEVHRWDFQARSKRFELANTTALAIAREQLSSLVNHPKKGRMRV
jgi:3',5'-cyclic AMP phosphodiesterase CpdA